MPTFVKQGFDQGLSLHALVARVVVASVDDAGAALHTWVRPHNRSVRQVPGNRNTECRNARFGLIRNKVGRDFDCEYTCLLHSLTKDA